MKLGLTLFGLGAAQWEAAYAPGHGGMVHLFEWSHAAIAEECEKMLGPKKWGAVQVSPPTENRIVGGQWWERYQVNRIIFLDGIKQIFSQSLTNSKTDLATTRNSPTWSVDAMLSASEPLSMSSPITCAAVAAAELDQAELTSTQARSTSPAFLTAETT
jgi:hypothetical protein